MSKIKLVNFITLLIILTSSCNSIRQSSYAKENLIKTNYYIHYFNDSLKLYIRFYGGHRPVNLPLPNYKKRTPKTIKTYLKKDFKQIRNNKIVFYSYSPWKQFGFYYAGFLHKHLAIDKNYSKETSSDNSIFFEKKGIEKVDSFLLKKYIIPLEHKDFVFYCFKKILYNYKADSSILQNDTHSELMSLRVLSNFKPYNQARKDFSDSVELAGDLPGYATPLNALLSLKTENRDNADIDFLNQFIFFCYASFDQLDSVRQLLYEQRTFKGNNIKNKRLDTLIVNNQLAISRILKEAASQKVIMINESHYDWRHRYFVTLLLDSLFKKGYKYLCMEALAKEKSINKRKFPTDDNGYYLKEPFTANLARTALKIGYQLIAYEDTTDNLEVNTFNSPIDKREYYQALNLYNRYKKDTAAKWLVYAGYSHINKSNFGATEPSTMAKYFSEFSHVNPYSINQTTYCDIFSDKVAIDSSGKSENYYYLRKDQIDDSTLLKQSDLYIINNIHTIPYEISSTTKVVQEYHIHYDKKGSEKGKYFIQVFLKDEYFQNHHAIPIYIKRTSDNVFDKNIWLPKNNYYLVVTDETDKIIFENDL